MKVSYGEYCALIRNASTKQDIPLIDLVILPNDPFDRYCFFCQTGAEDPYEPQGYPCCLCEHYGGIEFSKFVDLFSSLNTPVELATVITEFKVNSKSIKEIVKNIEQTVFSELSYCFQRKILRGLFAQKDPRLVKKWRIENRIVLDDTGFADEKFLAVGYIGTDNIEIIWDPYDC